MRQSFLPRVVLVVLRVLTILNPAGALALDQYMVARTPARLDSAFLASELFASSARHLLNYCSSEY